MLRCSIRVWWFDGIHHCPWLRYASFYADNVFVSNDNIARVMGRELIRWRNHK